MIRGVAHLFGDITAIIAIHYAIITIIAMKHGDQIYYKYVTPFSNTILGKRHNG
jgi:hypothetical protein